MQENLQKLDYLLAEEFIPGLQISTESIFSNYKCYTTGFADRLYNTTENFHPLIIENGGWVPSILKKNDIKDIKSLIESASKFLILIVEFLKVI